MRKLTFLLFFAILLHCNNSYSQYVSLDEEEQKDIIAERKQAVEEARDARPYDGYIEPVTQRQVYSEDYDAEKRAQEWAEQERLLAEEDAILAAQAAHQKAYEEARALEEQQAAEAAAEAAAAEEFKPLYNEGTQVRKTIAQKRAERRAAKEGRVFR